MGSEGGQQKPAGISPEVRSKNLLFFLLRNTCFIHTKIRALSQIYKAFTVNACFSGEKQWILTIDQGTNTNEFNRLDLAESFDDHTSPHHWPFPHIRLVTHCGSEQCLDDRWIRGPCL